MKHLFVTALFLLILGCAEPPYLVHKKLENTLQEDLKFMVAEIITGSSDTNVMAQPYYIITDLRFFKGDTARMYSGYADVDFFYFNDIPIKQKRKYRYDTRYRGWDRYYKELIFQK